MDDMERAVNEAFGPVWDDIRAAIQHVWDALGGAEGIAAIRANLDAWEAAHPGVRYGQPCDCWCRLRGHDGGICTGDAETITVGWLYGDPVHIPMCQACASAGSTVTG